ncbi:acetylcholine receptor subunit alpha-like 1 isoform X1 [Ostrea edulis]|uniref:acetylcholine receptor subunit alpha-like 1 isoform X1 n=1 Tax=Ostrea edulis TaxID=37623 RepID=UPI00209419BA|nr:acetylcholine receptor subunit alpha-like 1 isoform X1 [Ostrea edulis]
MTRISCWILCSLILFVSGNDDAKRLYYDLLKRSYNKLIRPVSNSSDKLIVKMGIRLSQLIDIDEKNQIMTTNVWLRQEWYDNGLTWNPVEYGGIKTIEVPIDDIWNPDVVLFNNADGNYEVTLMTKAILHPDGKVVWEPPAIYKSSCMIDVEFFPFDIQLCIMKFGSWTYDGNQVDLVHLCVSESSSTEVIQKGIDFRDFYPSVEWDILEGSAQKHYKRYICCPSPFPDITFSITMRRKTLFHTVNLIIPCVSISFLTVLVFYLPSDSGEKITLCISILLSLTVFFLLLADIIPPTSIVVPLIGKYLLFTMILVTLSILVTVIVLNVHFRSPSTHTMAPWVRRVFLNVLPRLLIMRRPNLDNDHNTRRVIRTCNGVEMTESYKDMIRRRAEQRKFENSSNFHDAVEDELMGITKETDLSVRRRQKPVPREIKDAVDSVCFIAEHLKKDDKENSIKEDWKYVAMVLDRLFLWIFTIACVVGTFGIILQAPTLYDDRQTLTPQAPDDSCIKPDF